MFEPVYLETYRQGRFPEKIARAYEILSACELCPHCCRVDRHHGERGFCRTGDRPMVSSYGPHWGEEDPLVGTRGSGAIFFTNCNLGCIFCQTWEISHEGEGEEITFADLAAIMLYLQEQGCHNVNLITPSHQVYQILEALSLAIAQGLHIPLVYNTGGYDGLEALRLLDGVVDIYLPDFKFWDPRIAQELAGARDYPEVARRAIKEMHRQVGDMVIDENGLARRGLLVRHLVLPDGLAGTREIMTFLAQEISRDTYVNVMGHYHPYGRAAEHPSLRRFIEDREYREAQSLAREAGLWRLDRREKLFRWV